MRIIFVDREKKLKILWVYCSFNDLQFFLNVSHISLFSFSLFQIVESTGDLFNRLGFTDVARHDSCSALVKVNFPFFLSNRRSSLFLIVRLKLLPNNADIFVSHADWSNYKTMLKVIKRYIMPVKRSNANGSKMNQYPLHGSLTFFCARCRYSRL